MCFWYILELHFLPMIFFTMASRCEDVAGGQLTTGCADALPQKGRNLIIGRPGLATSLVPCQEGGGSGYSWPQLAPGQWWSVSQDWPKFGLLWTKGAQRSWHWPMVSIDVLRSLDMKIRTEDLRSAWLVSAVRPRRAFLLAMSSSRAALVVWDGDINNWILPPFFPT